MSFFDAKTENTNLGDVMISLTIPRAIRTAVRMRGFTHREIYLMGFEVKNRSSPLLTRIKELEGESEQRKKDYYNLKIKFLELVERQKQSETAHAGINKAKP